MRRIVLSISGLVATITVFLAAAPTAFAMRVAPASGNDVSPAVAPATHHAALNSWELGLIVAAGVVLVVAAAIAICRAARRSRARMRLSAAR
jgi:hypothetical protein